MPCYKRHCRPKRRAARKQVSGGNERGGSLAVCTMRYAVCELGVGSFPVCVAVTALNAQFDEYMAAKFPELPEGISR